MGSWHSCTLLLWKTEGSFQNATESHHITRQCHPQVYTERTENIGPHKNLFTKVMKALFVIAPKWKQCKCPSTDEQKNKMRSDHDSGMLLSNQKEWHAKTSHQGEKVNCKDHISCDSTYMKDPAKD
jgi:hypothetical protein